MENEQMVTHREKYPDIEDDWYNFAIAQGEECLSGVVTAVSMVQGKSLWLFGALVGLVGAYLSFAAVSVDEVATWSIARLATFIAGMVASIPWIYSIKFCVEINWVTSFPNAGTKPAKIFFQEFLEEEHRKKLFKAACYKRLEDLNVAIDMAKAKNDDMGDKFNLALRMMFVGFLIFLIYFVGFIVALNLRTFLIDHLCSCA